MDGLLPVWKPIGVTSFYVTKRFKHTLKKMESSKVKIGHAGTLDPFAEGILVLMIGKATRKFDEIQKWSKTYRAVARLGAKSDTLDVTGVINDQPINPNIDLSLATIKASAAMFVGQIEQVVPQYSAAKYKGKPLYKYARSGEVTPEKKKVITIYSIEVESFRNNEVEMVIACSSGTYIRQLSYDIFKSMGVESYLVNLIRETLGKIDKNNCIKLPQADDVDMIKQKLLPIPDELVT